MVAKKKAAAVKRTTTQKSHSKKTSQGTKPVVYRTFQVAPDFPTFLQARVTKQTFYWSFLLLFIIIMQLIILAINYDATITLDSFNLK